MLTMNMYINTVLVVDHKSTMANGNLNIHVLPTLCADHTTVWSIIALQHASFNYMWPTTIYIMLKPPVLI